MMQAAAPRNTDVETALAGDALEKAGNDFDPSVSLAAALDYAATIAVRQGVDRAALVERIANVFDVVRRRHEEGIGSSNAVLEVLSRNVSDLPLPTRTKNALAGMGLATVADVVQVDASTILSRKNVGRKSLEQLKEVLASHGLRLGLKLTRAARK